MFWDKVKADILREKLDDLILQDGMRDEPDLRASLM